MTDQSFENKSYSAHQDWLSSSFPEKQALLNKIGFYINKKDTVLYWRHTRSFDFLSPLFKQQNKWLTVGDCFGSDSVFIASKNQLVLPTDLDDVGLKAAQEIGFIKDFATQNAEKMNLADNAYDYILCSEVYHHFPRPYMAMYEMIRVAKKAVILKDSQDPISRMPLLLFVANIIDRLNPLNSWKLWKNRFSFEPVGNFVYKLSRREIEKFAMGLNLPAIAIYGYNNPYKAWMEHEKIAGFSMKFTMHKLKLWFQNTLTCLSILPHDFLGVIIFKETPDANTIKELKDFGYAYIQLPKNPYIK